MKVNTDGVLLGAATLLPESADCHSRSCDSAKTSSTFEVLDAGTGTGTIALMLAQRLSDCGIKFHVHGIDLDRDSAEEAAENFRHAPWSEKLSVENVPLLKCPGMFDLIVSNPPYYDASLQNPDGRKNTARHTVAADEEGLDGAAMSWRTLLEFAKEHLKDHGELSHILPAAQEAALLRDARRCGFSPIYILRISTTERKEASRIVVQFARANGKGAAANTVSTSANTKGPSNNVEGTSTLSKKLTIQSNGDYSEQYRTLVKDFYLWA